MNSELNTTNIKNENSEDDFIPTTENAEKKYIQNNMGNQAFGNDISQNNYYIYDKDGQNRFRVKLPYRYGLHGLNNNFHGREKILEEIHSNLNKNSSTTVLYQKIVGLGGIGKTDTAKQYAKQNEDHYKIIIFAVAEDMTELRNTFIGISKEFNNEMDNVESTRQIMNKLYREINTYSKALIIFDNAEDPQKLRNDFLPQNSELDNIKILITSRNKTLNRKFIV